MAALCLMLFLACLYDYRKAKVPNWLVCLIFLHGAGFRYWDAGGGGLKEFSASFLTVLLMSYPLFKIGAVGAGDVKLYSAAAGYLSGRALACLLSYSLLVAACISIIKICRERSGKERFGYFCAYFADICRTGQWKLYFEDCADLRKAGVRLSGPLFVGVLLHLGGVY